MISLYKSLKGRLFRVKVGFLTIMQAFLGGWGARHGGLQGL